MIRNHLLVASRLLKRQFLYSFINIIGLAVGMAATLVIFLYVYGEWSYDRHFRHADRIYRISFSFFNIGQFANGPYLLGEYLPEYDVVERFTRFKKDGQALLFIGDRAFTELVYYADSSFFRVFDYEFLQGDPQAALDEPGSMVMTDRAAEKIFGTADAIGRIVEVGEERRPYQVTAIVSHSNRLSHLKASVWIALDAGDANREVWTSAAFYNYVLLREESSPEDLETALDGIVANHVFPTSGKQMGKETLDEYLADPNAVQFYVQPLRDIYLQSKLNLELSPGGNANNVIVFGIIGIFILTLAAVNFINLSTARSARRAREVGVRKSLGSTRAKLMGQFLLESIMVSTMAVVVALGIAELFTLVFHWITGQHMAVNLWAGITAPGLVLAFAVLVGLIAGIYPALYLTSFKPVSVLKGNLQPTNTSTFRNVLVVFQFSISIALIIATLVVRSQLNFMSNRDLGFSQENVLVIEDVGELGQRAEDWKSELEKDPSVVAASLCVGEPGSKATITMNTFRTKEMTNALTINAYYGDEDYLKVMGISLIKGRGFQDDLASDSAAVIFNEAAVAALGLHDNAIDAVVNDMQIVTGIVRDFHWESLRNTIAPVAILPFGSIGGGPRYAKLALKIRPGDEQEVLKRVQAGWEKRLAGKEMGYHFLDENFEALLRKEAVMGKAIGFFTILAVVISCLGLFGLAAYTTEQRMREIGIRKVMGASGADIVLMLNRKFAGLVAIAACLAIPLTYLAAAEWLAGFAYRIDISAVTFASGALLGLAVCLLTVAYHSFRATTVNPSETLRSE